MLQTKRALVITSLIAVAAVMAVSTMKVQPVSAPGGSCMGCLFAPGQLKITGQPAVGIGILARELGQPASQLAPGIQGQNLNSPG